MQKIKNKVSLLNFALAFILILYSIILIGLIIWAIFASLKAPSGTFNRFDKNPFGIPQGLPWQWQWSNYSIIFSNLAVKVNTASGTYLINVVEMFMNTILYAGVGALVATITPCFVAYVCAKTNFRFNNILISVVLITAIIPIVGSYISEIRVMQSIGLYDTWVGVIIQRMNFLGVYFLIFLGSFRGLSNTYAESAQIDGAGDYGIMLRIYIPLVSNIILTVFLLKFIEYWNDFQYPLLFLSTKPTLAYGVYYLVHKNGENILRSIPMKLAGSIILFVPIFIIFCFSKKLLMQNINIGGVKE